MADLSRSPLAPLMSKIYPVSYFIGYRRPAPTRRPGADADDDGGKQPRKRFWDTAPGQLLERAVRVLIGAWTGIALLTVIARSSTFKSRDSPIAIGSFGAVMVVIYSIPGAPFAQPRHVVIGNTMAAIIGTAVTKLFALNGAFETGVVDNRLAWAAAATACAIATSLNEIIDCQHPPSGATALLAAILPEIHALSWWYPGLILISSLLMVAWACIVNNVSPSTRYPTYWIDPGLFKDREEGTGRVKNDDDTLVENEKRDPRAVSQASLSWKSRGESRSPARSVDPFENRIMQAV